MESVWILLLAFKCVIDFIVQVRRLAVGAFRIGASKLACYSNIQNVNE